MAPRWHEEFSVWRLLRMAMLLTTAAWVAHVFIYFHERYTHHRTLQLQFMALATSPVCSDSAQRVMSSNVNNCDRAERVASGLSLPPLTVAALETLESMSLCGDNGLRCYQLITDIKNASLQLVLVFVVVVVAAGWLLLQKLRIECQLSKDLPLDSPNYPMRVPLYVNHKID